MRSPFLLISSCTLSGGKALKPRILLTGFGPFPGVPVNPTGALMERIAADPGFFPEVIIEAVALETAFLSARKEFERRAAAFGPHAILSFGVATHEASHYRIERIAANWDDSKAPDRKGEHRRGQQIDEAGPAQYGATLPLEKIEAALRAANIPVRVSDTAGNYVCNHIFYSACHWASRRTGACIAGFIHVPDPAQSPDWANGAYAKTLETVSRLALGVVTGELAGRKN